MAITFLQEKKRQRRMVLILGVLIVAILIVVWQGFLKKEEEAPPIIPQVLVPKEVKIDWETLKDPKLEELQAFEGIKPFEEEIGRENSFLPY